MWDFYLKVVWMVFLSRSNLASVSIVAILSPVLFVAAFGALAATGTAAATHTPRTANTVSVTWEEKRKQKKAESDIPIICVSVCVDGFIVKLTEKPRLSGKTCGLSQQQKSKNYFNNSLSSHIQNTVFCFVSGGNLRRSVPPFEASHISQTLCNVKVVHSVLASFSLVFWFYNNITLLSLTGLINVTSSSSRRQLFSVKNLW